MFKKAGKNETLALHFSEAGEVVVLKRVWFVGVVVGKWKWVKGWWWEWSSFTDVDEEEEEWVVEKNAGEDKAMVNRTVNWEQLF